MLEMGRFLLRATLAGASVLGGAFTWAWNDGTHFQMAKLAALHLDGSAPSPWNADLFDRNLFRTDTGYGLRMYSKVEGKTLLDWFAQGCEDEDHQFLGGSPIYHFFNPVNNTGLSDGILPATDSMHWAYNGGNATFWNPYTWVQARHYLLKSLTLPTATQRRRAAASMFECLGHVAHLVEDLSQPQHTRNDNHKDEYDANNGIEAFVTSRITTLAELKYVLQHHPDWFLEMPFCVSQIDTTIPVEFQALWDTEDYRGQNNFVSVLTGQESVVPGRHGLAEFTNFNFVTRDTLFTSNEDLTIQYPGVGGIPYWNDRTYNVAFPNRRFEYPKLRQTTLAEWLTFALPSTVKSIRAAFKREDGLPLVQTSYFSANLGATGDNGYIWLDDRSFDRMSLELLGLGVDYTWLMLKQFFRANLEHGATFVKDGEEFGYSYLRAWAVGHAMTPSSQGWTLFQGNASGSRWQVSVAKADKPGIAAAGFGDFKFYPKPWLGESYTLVFQGKLGSEREAVVGMGITIKQVGLTCFASDGYDGALKCYVTKSSGGTVEYNSPTISLATVFPVESTHVWGASGQATADHIRLVDKRREPWRYATGKVTVRMNDATDNREGKFGSDSMLVQFQGTYDDDSTPCEWSNSSFDHGAVFPSCSSYGY